MRRLKATCVYISLGPSNTAGKRGLNLQLKPSRSIVSGSFSFTHVEDGNLFIYISPDEEEQIQVGDTVTVTIESEDAKKRSEMARTTLKADK